MPTSEPLRHKAYLSEPITRCPVRERGRIKRLVDQIKESIEEHPFLTKLYIPSLVSDPEVRKSLTPEHVYLLDRIRIVEADFLLVLADHTSFGVGGEVEMATNLGKPIVFFSRDKKLSRFLLGTPASANRAFCNKGESSHNPYYIHYREWRDLKAPFLSLVSKVLTQIGTPSVQLPVWDISKNLRKLRVERGWSQEELAMKSGVFHPQLALWEKSLSEIIGELQAYQKAGQLDLDPIELNSTQLEQLSNPSLNALHKISRALGVPVSELLGDSSERLLNKGPAKITQHFSDQLIRSRTEALELRAFQFDVTFREFRHLRKVLVDDYFQYGDVMGPNCGGHPDRIPEQEFLNHIQDFRTRKRQME